MYQIRIETSEIDEIKGIFNSKEIAKKFAISWYLIWCFNQYGLLNLQIDKTRFKELVNDIYCGVDIKTALIL